MKSVLRQYTTLRAAQPANSFWRAHKATFDTVRYHLLSAQKQRSKKLYADGSMGQHNTSAASNESLEAARHERLHRGIDDCRRQCPSRLRRGNNMPAYHVRAVIPSPHRLSPSQRVDVPQSLFSPRTCSKADANDEKRRGSRQPEVVRYWRH